MTLRGEIVWKPDAERTKTSRLRQFGGSKKFTDLHKWSVASPDEFWAQIWDFCGVVGERGSQVIERFKSPEDPSLEFISTKFFPESNLSIVENFLRKSGRGEAIVAIDESGKRTTRTWDELRSRVASFAGALEKLGVVAGDRVVAWLPNGIEAIETMLATASIGAVFSSCSPDFGAQGVLDRFSQISPRVLVSTHSYIYGGKKFD